MVTVAGDKCHGQTWRWCEVTVTRCKVTPTCVVTRRWAPALQQKVQRRKTARSKATASNVVGLSATTQRSVSGIDNRSLRGDVKRSTATTRTVRRDGDRSRHVLCTLRRSLWKAGRMDCRSVRPLLSWR